MRQTKRKHNSGSGYRGYIVQVLVVCDEVHSEAYSHMMSSAPASSAIGRELASLVEAYISTRHELTWAGHRGEKAKKTGKVRTEIRSSMVSRPEYASWCWMREK